MFTSPVWQPHLAVCPALNTTACRFGFASFSSRIGHIRLLIEALLVACRGCMVTLQVRQKLYTSSIGSWQAYEAELEPLQRRLASLISKYEDEWDLQRAGSPLLHQEL